MSFFPQTGNGVIAQFPFRRTRHWRAITNQVESGELISLPDLGGGEVGWTLKYDDLSSSESQAISELFSASQGQFGSFTFVDPMANLLGWSEDLSQANWQTLQLGITAGLTDPLGTTKASQVSNSGPGTLALSQTLGISGDYVACFSVYVQAASSTTISLQRDSLQNILKASPQWSRLMLSGTGTAGAAQSTFSLNLTAGQTVNIFGLQVEAQPCPSAYKPTAAASGIYEETYFADGRLTVTSTAPGLSRASINLISRT